MSSNSIDAQLMARMFQAGARNLEAKKEWINELNVFPVPDGDTGTNMTLTITWRQSPRRSHRDLCAAREAIQELSSPSFSAAAARYGAMSPKSMRRIRCGLFRRL